MTPFADDGDMRLYVGEILLPRLSQLSLLAEGAA